MKEHNMKEIIQKIDQSPVAIAFAQLLWGVVSTAVEFMKSFAITTTIVVMIAFLLNFEESKAFFIDMTSSEYTFYGLIIMVINAVIFVINRIFFVQRAVRAPETVGNAFSSGSISSTLK